MPEFDIGLISFPAASANPKLFLALNHPSTLIWACSCSIPNSVATRAGSSGRDTVPSISFLEIICVKNENILSSLVKFVTHL